MTVIDTRGPQKAPKSTNLDAFLLGPITPILLRLAGPNIAAFMIMSFVAVAEMWYVGQLGTSALAGFAVVFPLVMLMQMLSSGAIGGVIAATTARALGANNTERANRIVWHALVIAVIAAAIFTSISIFWSAEIAAKIGARDESLQHAVEYAHVVFGGILSLWIFNILSSLLRGSGDMKTPALAMIVTASLQIIISGTLTLGWFGVPSIGIAGVGWGLVTAMLAGCAITIWKIASGASAIQFSRLALKIDPQLMKDLGRVGGMAAFNPFLSVSTIVMVMALASRFGESTLAGFGVGSRLEFILIPIVFGLGAAMISLVGTNIGAGNIKRAEQIGWIGGGIAAATCGLIGLFMALVPNAWAGIFTDNPLVFMAAASYLQIVGPAYIFFALGLSLYFASQGAHAVFWPVLSSVGRVLIAGFLGGYAINTHGVSYDTLLYFVAASLCFYGMVPALALACGAWRHANR